MQTIASFICSDENSDFTSPLQESIKKVEENVKKLLEANGDALSKRIKQLELQLNKKTTEIKENRSNKPASNETLEHEAVFIGDSNTKEIDMATIGQNVKRKRFTCYTIPQTKQFLNTAKIKKQPKKVLLHLGTNDVVGADVDDLKKEFKELTTLARAKFPDARIYLSSIFRRKNRNDNLNAPIRTLNQYLEDFCDTAPRFTFIDNGNIPHRDMRDPKHLNETGLETFLWNLRTTIFGETYLPSMPGRR